MLRSPSGGIGCGGIILLLALGLGGWILYVKAVEPIFFPAQAADRRANIAAANARDAAKILEQEQREVQYRASLLEEEREKAAALARRETELEAIRQNGIANDKVSDELNEAAFKRYADCQVRNQTPGRCDEDWRPTTEIKAMMEMMDGR